MQNRGIQVLLILFVLTASIPLTTTAVNESPRVESKTGIVIQLTPTTEQEQLEKFNTVLEDYSSDPNSNAFILDDASGNTWLVFSDTPPKPGKATVEGTVFTASELGSELGIIIASNVEITQQGTPTDLAALREHPNRYDGRLLRVTSHYRQLAFATETSGPQTAQQTSFGGFTEKTAWFNLTSPGERSRWATFNLSSADQPRRLTQTTLNVPAPLVGARTPRFWINARTTVDLAVVVRNGQPFYRVVQTNVQADSMSGPEAVTANAKSKQGAVVSFKASVVGAKLSSQETILAASKCAPMSATNPVTGCVPIPVDTTLHTGILFDDVPTTLDDALPYVAVSSHHQQQVSTLEHGKYRVTGRVVPTSQLNVNLAASHALIVYEMERIGDLRLSQSALSQAKSYAQTNQELYTRQIQGASPSPDESRQTTTSSSSSTTTTHEPTNATTESPVNATTEPPVNATTELPGQTEPPSETDSRGGGFDTSQMRFLAVVFGAGAVISWIGAGVLSGINGYRSTIDGTGAASGSSGVKLLRWTAYTELGLAIGLALIGYAPNAVSTEMISVILWFSAVVCVVSVPIVQVLIWVKQWRDHSVQTSDREMGVLLLLGGLLLLANYLLTGQGIALLGTATVSIILLFAWLLQWTYQAL